MIGGRNLAVTLAIAIAFATGARAEPAASRAAGGDGLLTALEQAPTVIVGSFDAVTRIDVHGYKAGITVEQVIRGEAKPGSRVEVAWEELARSRQPRFADGDRALVALTRLPGASLWSQRFPEPGSRQRVFAVAADGQAFWRRPTQAAIDLIEHFLALDAASRSGSLGVGYLAQLIAGSEVEMSIAAVDRLFSVADLDGSLDAASANALMRGLLRPDANDRLRTRVLDLIETRHLESVRAPLEALADRKPLPPPIVFVALGRLSGELSPKRTGALLDRDEVYRRAGARYASGTEAPGRLVGLMRADPDAGVRAAAVARLVELRGERGIGAAADRLADRDASVRLAAARALATLGEVAVPSLRSVVDTGETDAAIAAVAGLGAVGVAGQPALMEIATHHPHDGIRTLARVALGGSLDDHHRH